MPYILDYDEEETSEWYYFVSIMAICIGSVSLMISVYDIIFCS
jgi:hypothetical protein